MIRQRPARRGGVAVWVLFVLPVLVLLLVLGVTTCEVGLLTEQSRRTADACAQDAAAALVGDDLLEARLYGRGGRLRPTFDAAHAQAERAAHWNLIFGRPVAPDRNPDNDPRGEFVLGAVEHYGYRVPFDPAGPAAWAGVNAVRVHYDRRGRDGVPLPGGLREDLVVTATALLDGDVAGFRPLGETSVLPVAPLALDRRAWDAGLAAAPAVGLPDITVRLMAAPDPNPARGQRPTAVPLTIGTRNVIDLATQLATGVTAGEYDRFTAAVGGPFELDDRTGRLAVPGDRYTGPALDPLGLALDGLRRSGDIRVWPTTVQFDPRNDRLVWATGFVAARVVGLRADEVTYRPAPGSPVTLRVRVLDVTLRPAMLGTPTAVTRPAAPANPYVCTVRLLTAD